MIVEITNLKRDEKSFFIRYDNPITTSKAALQLGRDYSEIFDQDTSVDKGNLQSEDFLEDGLTLKVTDGYPDDRGLLLDFIDVLNPVKTGSVHQIKVRQNHEWTDVYRFAEFHAGLMDKYGF